MRGRGLALLPLILAALSVVEVVAFVAVAHAIGGAWAVLLLLLASLAGLALLRREGIKGWRRFRAAADEGRPPGPQVSNSLVGLLGALLIAVPGFVTAAAGLLLLVPPGRTLVRRAVERSTERRMDGAAAGNLFGPRRVDVVVDAMGDQSSAAATTARTPAARPAAAIEGEVVEGEVVR